MNDFLIGVAAVVVVAVISRALRPTVSLPSPTLGVLNLLGPSAASEKAADRAALAPFFASISESASEPPVCNVLLIYCALEPDGAIRGSVRGLKELVCDSGALVAIVASENDFHSYRAALKRKTSHGRANLVLTISRHGDVFANFFQRLFTKMQSGVPMPSAWRRLAFRRASPDYGPSPSVIYLRGRQVIFK